MRARIRFSNMVQVLRRWPNAKFGVHHTNWHDGCADPGCCLQHPGLTREGEQMLGVEIPNISGREFRRGMLELANEGLVKLSTGPDGDDGWTSVPPKPEPITTNTVVIRRQG